MQAFDNFRTNVRTLLQRKGISVREFAELLQTSHSYLFAMFRGESVPSLDRCEQMATALDVPLEKLISEKI